MTGKVLGLLLLVCVVSADINLHNPRGSNNRLDEQGRARRNANRLFDSQNNNRGGHNVGNLYYYTGSHLQIQWANQHSCNDRNNHCELVLQYMCGDLVRDGTTTNTIPENNQACSNRNCNTDLRYGMHEDHGYYAECKTRERNKGLFIADRNLRNRDTAKYTRQNNNGQRRGYECPEERDYYPYWHPAPWKDIAVFTNNASRCEMYRRESENVKGRYKCILPDGLKKDQPNFRIPNNKAACEAVKYPNTNQGTSAQWVRISSHKLPAPDCRQSIWSRDNHQGNVEGGEFMSYDWLVPNTPHEQCVFRIRYNITAGEYDGWDPAVNSALNGRRIYYHTKYNLPITEREARARGYYYRNDPDVRIFKDVPGFRLRIQINTNQDARTFQDRSHTFSIRRRPANLRKAHIHNVNVRGKRGNIVQVYPSTEYDFVPNSLTMNEGQYVHFQWTGSNSNPNNNAGEGRAGSDRHNVLPLADPVYSEGVSRANTYGHLGRNYPKNIKDATFLGFSLADKTSLAVLTQDVALGMQEGTIPNSRITASSMWDANHSPSRARLGTVREKRKRGAWSSRRNDVNQWIQVDLGRVGRITAIATQGRQDFNQWVKSYSLQYSSNGNNFLNYNRGQVFMANNDRNTIVRHVLEPAIVARYFRIRPKSWFNHISMRFEIYGRSSGGLSSGENQQLDDAAPYHDLGPRVVTGKGIYYYMCTRNNNFTNRSQKAKIVVI